MRQGQTKFSIYHEEGSVRLTLNAINQIIGDKAIDNANAITMAGNIKFIIIDIG
ncbi:hypothetical protein K734_03420 [Idiomarina loihiensis GSL 199]|uniref:Uncharacterized protein n=1 Tax=Idiomarina loihiensis (strain ATCC BAA-735 / DSM 15497 / L2-TR) TaxID=283942 RepID=Q5R0C8_IDILO|nr:Hypothetical protein IL0682 [Idiomarina loihiensis L2TR]AGM35551.1 hypothetical protein K734_03420 [Idiomarina loihiensis GSL 199]